MTRILCVALVTGLLVACSGAAPAAPPNVTASVAASARTSTAAVPASAVAQPSGPSSPTAPVRSTGTVQSVSGVNVTLADGTSFALAPDARVLRQQTATVADLKRGQLVAVTAKRQPDNTLLASIVSVFSESLSKSVPPGQRPLPEGNLMTNATIDMITGDSFTVSFPGGGAQVQIAPGAQLLQQLDASAADIKPGASVSALVADGTARNVLLQ